MIQLIKRYTLLGLLLLIPFITWSQIAMDGQLTNIRFEGGQLKFILELKGNNEYIPFTNEGDFLASNIRFDFALESGVTIDVPNATVTKMGEDKVGALDFSVSSYLPGSTAGAFMSFQLSRKSVREGNTLDFNQSTYVAVLDVSIPVTGTLTSATKIVPRDFNNFPIVNRSSIWGNGFGIANMGFNWSLPEYKIDDYTCPPTATWLGTANDNNWNNAANWDINNIPGKCTYVTIPAGKTSYPVLTAAMNAKCGTIYFEFGGEVDRKSVV